MKNYGRNVLLILLAFSKFIKSEDLKKHRGEDCYRECRDSEPRICFFDFQLEHYHVLGPACGTCGKPDGNKTDCYNEDCLTADGVVRGVMSINRQIPGPSIHVCKNDLIVVDVTNKMSGTSTTIHWHGFHQRKTPFYDGVPFVTQCPIPFSNTFRYSFWASEPGTQFYHSHAGHHKMNGIFGGIVVRRDSETDPNGHLYNNDLKEHLIVVSDWLEDYAEMFVPGLVGHPTGNEPTNILMNFKGNKWDQSTGKAKNDSPLAVFHIEEGQCYRFRLVNSMGMACPAELEIENHSLLVIASDSYDLQPVSVDQLVSQSGERYDFVLNANQSHKGDTFWIKLKALGSCAKTRQVLQLAVLTYKPKTSNEDHHIAFPDRKIPSYKERFVSGDAQYKSLNHPNTTCGAVAERHLCISDLHSYIHRPEVTDREPDFQFILGFKNYAMKNEDIFGGHRHEHFTYKSTDHILLVSAVNNISLTFPPMSLLTQHDEFDESLFCSQYDRPERCDKQICHCVHRLKVPLNSIVELVVADENTRANKFSHPFHLHGTNVYVMEMGQKDNKEAITIGEVEIMLAMLELERSSYSPKLLHPLKDTISIPPNGFTRFRFKADNPGFWLLHCHFEWHLAMGMGLIFQVGEPDEMVKPPQGFPKCNNFKPNVDEIFKQKNE